MNLQCFLQNPTRHQADKLALGLLTAALLAGPAFAQTIATPDTIKAVEKASEFLKEQGKIPEVLADYTPYVTADFVKQAAATN